MEDEEYQNKIDNFKHQNKEKKKIDFKKVAKMVFDTWINISVGIYKGMVKFSTSIQERQEDDEVLDKKVKKVKKYSNKKSRLQKKSGLDIGLDQFGEGEDQFKQSRDWGF